MVFHKPTKRYGEVVCATSDHADGSPRVIVEWEGGEESTVIQVELEKVQEVFFHRTQILARIH